MTLTARLLTLLAVISFLAACGHRPTPPALSPTARRGEPPAATSPSPDALLPSPRRFVGRILAVDAARGFAFVALSAEAPTAAVAEGAELIARTDDLRETARLRTSAYTRGHTLGTTIASGHPSPGDEVVFESR